MIILAKIWKYAVEDKKRLKMCLIPYLGGRELKAMQHLLVIANLGSIV